MIGWHFTTFEQDVIDPYPIGRRPDKEWIRNRVIALTGSDRAIWIWVNKPDDKLLRDFMIWKIVNQPGVESGRLLEVGLDPERLLSRQLNSGSPFVHTLTLKDKIVHTEIFDLYLGTIKDFRMVKEISLKIETL